MDDDEGAAPGPSSTVLEQTMRAMTQLALGSTGLAISSVRRLSGEDPTNVEVSEAASTLTTAAMALGLRTERAIVRTTVAAGGVATGITWAVARATPLRRPLERLAEEFRAEQHRSEEEVSDAIGDALGGIGGAVLSGVEVDRVIDRLALERVMARIDHRELLRRIEAKRAEEREDAADEPSGSTG